MFQVGDQVVCVDAGPCQPQDVKQWAAPSGAVGLQKGETYTIAAFGVWYGDGCTPVVFLVETRNGRPDAGYLPRRFRKVQRRKTDLSIESFLTIKPGFEEPRRSPKRAPKQVPA
jgi:hypothetical protein